jgi:mono/diheme cytochrome c family protein
MSIRIVIGIVLFLIIFVVVGVLSLDEGLLDVQARDKTGRMQVFETGFDARYLENGALLFSQYCVICHGDKGEGVAGKGPELNPYLFQTRFPELKAQNYPNTLENFVRLTVAAGRPVFSTYWVDKGQVFAENMPTWASRFGGPLRDDQIEYLTAYILSWGAGVVPTTTVEFDAVGADVEVELPAGDAARGEQIWNKTVNLANGRPSPCSACHSLDGSTLVGPTLQGIGARAGSTVSGQDAETYIRHSIQAPNEHIVPGATFVTPNGDSLMPGNLGDTMSAQPWRRRGPLCLVYD